MKLAKAISKLQTAFLKPRRPRDPELQDALIVGINSIKELRAYRQRSLN